MKPTECSQAAERIKHSSTCVLRDRCGRFRVHPIFLWICQNHRSSVGIIEAIAPFAVLPSPPNRATDNSLDRSDRRSSSAMRDTQPSPGASEPVGVSPSSLYALSCSTWFSARSAAFSSRHIARLLTLRSPCFVAFCLDLALPAAVLGPVLRSHGLFLSAVARREFNPFRDRR